MGILDFGDPEGLSQLGMLGGLLTAKKGDNWGLLLQNAAMQQEQRKKQMMQEQMQKLQFEQMQQAQAQQQTDRGALMGAPNFGSPTAPNMAPTPENAAQLKTPSQFDQASKMVEYLRGKGVSPANIKPYMEQMEKFRPKAKADQQLVKLPDGSLGMVNIMDDGTHQVMPFSPAEKQQEVNLGGSVGMAGQYSGKLGQQFNKTLSPDAQYQGGVTMRGQNMTDARVRERFEHDANSPKPQLYDGSGGPMWVTPPVRGGSAATAPVPGPDGQPIGAKKRDQPLTEAQGNATAYAMRAAQSEQLLRGIEKGGHNPAAFPGIQNRMAGGALNVLSSDAAQQYNAAKQNFVTAVLRKESGAAISQSEFDKEDQKYFPQPGDGPGVRAQKQKARELAIHSLEVQSGPGMKMQGGPAGWSITRVN